MSKPRARRVAEASGSESSATPIPPLALRAPAAAMALSISPRALHALTQAGRVPHLRLVRSVLYPTLELQRWLSEQASKGTSP